MGNRSQVSLGTHLTARYRQTEGATFSDSYNPWDMEAHVDLSPPPPPHLGTLGTAGSTQRWQQGCLGPRQQQTGQAAEHVLCIAMDRWGDWCRIAWVGWGRRIQNRVSGEPCLGSKVEAPFLYPVWLQSCQTYPATVGVSGLQAAGHEGYSSY